MSVFTLLIGSHAFAAVTALVLGGWQLFASKGGTRHRTAGRVWVLAMLYVSVSSFWITELRPGQFSFLHVLSVVTVVTVSLGFWQARAGRIDRHRGNMVGSYIGLCFAFAFAVAIPSRDVPTFVMTEPAQAAAALGCIAVLTTAVVATGGRLERARSARVGPPAPA